MSNNSSIKVILYTSKVLKNGEHPIMLRIIKDRKSKYFSIGHSCHKNFWDFTTQRPKNSHPNKRRLNIYINTKIAEIENVLLDLEIKNDGFSLEAFKKQIDTAGANVNVFEYIDIIVDEQKMANKIGNSEVYKQTKNMLFNFSQRTDLYFSDINVAFLNKYENYFKMNGAKEISISYYMRTLRSVFNKAINNGFCNKGLYPFNDYKISKLSTRTVKRAITKDDIKLISSLVLDESLRQFHSKNYFMFSYYNMGMNFSDIAHLKWSDIQNNRIKYIRSKTGRSYDISILPTTKDILDYYKKNNINNSGYIFPILGDTHINPVQIKNRIHKVLGQTNNDLKEIAKTAGLEVNLTTYVARHTFATVLKRSGVPTAIISEGMGHDSEKTTQIYLDSFENTVLDEANKNLL